jgi:hypothetical protein
MRPLGRADVDPNAAATKVAIADAIDPTPTRCREARSKRRRDVARDEQRTHVLGAQDRTVVCQLLSQGFEARNLSRIRGALADGDDELRPETVELNPQMFRRLALSEVGCTPESLDGLRQFVKHFQLFKHCA